jgi:hypothetical protein
MSGKIVNKVRKKEKADTICSVEKNLQNVKTVRSNCKNIFSVLKNMIKL